MASRILSIDLQSDLLTAVILKNDINKDIIASAAIIPAEKTLQELITELITRLDCSNCRCVLSLNSSYFSFQNLSLPFQDRKAIDKILPFELEESTAVAIDTMLIDAIVTPGNDEGSEVITAMIEHTRLAEIHSALKQAGIPPEIITLSGLPTIAEIQEAGQAPDEFIFLDLRLDNATLFLISSGKLQLVRTLPFTPFRFATGPMAKLAVNAEDGKLQVQELEHSGESFRQLALMVRQTLTPLLLQSSQEQIPIYIDGTAGSASETSSCLEASTAFDRPCLICGRVGLLPLPMHLPKQTEEHAVYLNACLSLGKQADKRHDSFNFSKGTFAFRSSLSDYQNKAKTVGGILLVALVISLSYLWYNTGSLQNERTAIISEIHKVFKDTLPGVTRIVAPVQQLKVAVNNIRNSAGSEQGTTLPRTVLHVLQELSTRLPDSMDIRIIRMLYEENGLRLMGVTDSFNTVDSMKKALEQSPDFATVTISSTKQNPRDNRIRFELKIQISTGAQQ